MMSPRPDWRGHLGVRIHRDRLLNTSAASSVPFEHPARITQAERGGVLRIQANRLPKRFRGFGVALQFPADTAYSEVRIGICPESVGPSP